MILVSFRSTIPLAIRLVIGWMALAGAAPVFAQADPDPTRFEDEIGLFETIDRVSPPTWGGILFVGSSSIRMWETLEEDFSDRPVIRRGFGGSHFSDLLHYADRVVFPYEPRLIFVYEGDNDVASGKSPARVFGDFREFVGRVKERLPGTRVAFLAIKPSRARWDYVHEMREVNALVEQRAKVDSAVVFVDTFSPMLGESGEPMDSLFVDDRLHLSPRGYAVWREIVREILE